MNLEDNMRAAAEFDLKHAHRQDRFHHLLPDNNRHENYFLFVNTLLGEHRLKPHLHLHHAPICNVHLVHAGKHEMTHLLEETRNLRRAAP